MPSFSRTQLGVILLLGAGLVLLWGWRSHFGLPSVPPPAQTLKPVFVEVAGAVARPGVFVFPSPPTLSAVLAQAGVDARAAQKDKNISSGRKIEIFPDGQWRLGRMTGPQLLTLGLALDLNSATAADLEALPGIGPSLGKRIIDYRQAHGSFKKIEDLEQVSGIGPKNLARIRPYLFIEDKGNDR